MIATHLGAKSAVVIQNDPRYRATLSYTSAITKEKSLALTIRSELLELISGIHYRLKLFSNNVGGQFLESAEAKTMHLQI